MDQGIRDYQDQQRSIKNFFPRFPSKPNLVGKTILEFGCGRGAFLETAKEIEFNNLKEENILN